MCELIKHQLKREKRKRKHVSLKWLFQEDQAMPQVVACKTLKTNHKKWSRSLTRVNVGRFRTGQKRKGGARGGGGGYTDDDLYGEAPPERGTFFRLLVYQMVRKSFKNKMSCNPKKCKELIFRSKGNNSRYNPVFDICPCCSVVLLEVTIQSYCKFQAHV